MQISELRIRPRQILVLVIVFFVILIFTHRQGKQTCNSFAANIPEHLQAIYLKHKNHALPTIYAITPTYYRDKQKAELTRLSHVFMLVPNLHWILVEDSDKTTSLVRNVLERAGLTQRSTQLNVKTPTPYEKKTGDKHWAKPRGVAQRNLALSWIRENVNADKHNIVFFMDDDNTYSLELFAEMNKIERGRVGVWPVGLVGGLMVEKPLLNEEGTKVIGFNAIWRPERLFPIDMAAFAISADLLFANPEAKFAFDVERGYQETTILKSLTTKENLQPLANHCREVLVWHTRSEATKISPVEFKKPPHERSDAGIEV